MLEHIVRLLAVNGNDRLIVSVTNRMCVFIIYNLAHCCDLWEIRSFFRTSVSTLNTDTNKVGSVLLLMPKYCYAFQKS